MDVCKWVKCVTPIIYVALMVAHVSTLPQVRLQSRIINGNEASPKSFPFQVLLSLTKLDDRQGICGGALISRWYILTAGHCGYRMKNAEALLGAHNISAKEPTAYRRNITKILIHERFDPENLDNDIALFKLEEMATLTDNIKLINLPTMKDRNKSYFNCIATTGGWGSTGGLNPQTSSVLMSFNATIMTNLLCWKWFPAEITLNNICINGNHNQSSCRGDSGGPLIVDNVLVGVTSFGNKRCLPGYPTVFTRITRFLPWIRSHSDVKIERH